VGLIRRGKGGSSHRCRHAGRRAAKPHRAIRHPAQDSRSAIFCAGVTTNGSPSRAFTHDGAGNILTDTKGGTTTAYDYNNAGQPSRFTVGNAVHCPYFYNGFRQLASRQVTAGQPTTRIHMIYDLGGNLLGRGQQ
jgi:YD repeat-containing protein